MTFSLGHLTENFIDASTIDDGRVINVIAILAKNKKIYKYNKRNNTYTI
jgi:hypothetical protein